MKKNPEDGAMKRTQQAVLLSGVAFAIAALSFFGVHASISVAIGAVIASLNLFVLSRTVRNMVDGGNASWAGAAVLKFLVLMAGTYGLIRSGTADPLGLAVGFGAMPFGILLSGTFTAPHDTNLASAPSGAASEKTDHA